MRLAVLALALVCSACGWWDDLTGPSDDTKVNVDTAMRRLVDGAGNEGPVRARFLELSRVGSNPVPFRPAGSDTNISLNPFNFKAEVCMDSIPNPTGSPYLSGMALAVIGSPDGHESGSGRGAASEVEPYTVQNGTCVTIKRMQVDKGGTAGAEFLLLDLDARYVLIGASFGPPPFSGQWSGGACSSFEEIARTDRRPLCVLRFATPLE